MGSSIPILVFNKDRVNIKAAQFSINPDYAVEFVMKVTNIIKMSVCAVLLLAILLNYGNNKKLSKRLCLKYLKNVIEF